MKSGNQGIIFNLSQKSIILLFFTFIIAFLLFFKNTLFKPNLILKNFGEISVDPEIAFNNNKPTFLEFYAEWCEVCKEMAPKIVAIKDTYSKDVNFVFLNVDNPKWDFYIKKFNVNGIPQVNLFDTQANLKDTFIGRQQEDIIKDSLDNLNDHSRVKSKVVNDQFSLLKENKNIQTSPLSHG